MASDDDRVGGMLRVRGLHLTHDRPTHTVPRAEEALMDRTAGAETGRYGGKVEVGDPVLHSVGATKRQDNELIRDIRCHASH